MPENKGFGWNEDTESGLPDDFDAVIQTAVFAEGGYGVRLELSLLRDTGGENVPAWYSMGKGDFVVLDGGLSVSGPRLKDTSKAALLLASIKKLGVTIPGGASSAALEGLRFHWKRSTMSALAGREIKINDKEPDMLAPTAFLGKAAVTKPAEGTAVAADITTVSEAFLEVLGGATKPMRHQQLIITAANAYPEIKQDIIKSGRAALSKLVEGGEVEETEEGFRLGVTF